MKKIGLTGGIASGKTKVAKILHNHGAGWINVDRLTHEVLREPEIIDQIEARWWAEHGHEPTYMMTPDQIRRLVAKIVFANPTELKWLEELTYPRIYARLCSSLECYKNGLPAVIIDAPLLFECGWDSLCNEIWFIDAEPCVRERRFRSRTYPATNDFAVREANQWPVEKKKEKSTVVIDNNGNFSHTIDSLRPHWDAIVQATGCGYCLSNSNAALRT